MFQILKQRSPAVAGAVGDIEAEHRLEAERLRRFAQMVDDILADQEFRATPSISPRRISSITNVATWPRKSSCCFPPRWKP